MRRAILAVFILGVVINLLPVYAQSELAASLQVIGETVTFRRADTQNALPLNPNAVTAFGAGDEIITGDNGRVIINFADAITVLLLPESSYTLETFAASAESEIEIQATLSGIAVHDISEQAQSITYGLSAATFEVIASSDQASHFAVWSIEGGLQAATVASGGIQFIDEDQSIVLDDRTGFATPFSQMPSSFDEEIVLHAAQVVKDATDCHGVVDANGTLGIRLRAGAALDYIIVDLVDDGRSVQITGTTENGLWYRIPFQTGFGWMFSELIAADCGNIPVFPDLYREDPESIDDVTAIELPLLEPFYGTPQSNRTFYR